jgi:hypothetical protein
MTTYQLADLIIKIVALGATAAGAIFAAVTFDKNRRLEKAKWLTQLHDKFFGKDSQYTEMRKLLDYHDDKAPSQDYILLSNSIENNLNDNIDLQEKLLTYLNFFEYIATLWKTEQLKPEEIRLMFGYYLKSLRKHKWIMAFLENYSENDFKNIPALISKIEETENKK